MSGTIEHLLATGSELTLAIHNLFMQKKPVHFFPIFHCYRIVIYCTSLQVLQGKLCCIAHLPSSSNSALKYFLNGKSRITDD
mmetsp:Transcript_16194/g.27973  ORF Transcript_16194/g.27973 Transcript_16194/m.27973 type:complete len:82 (-) Transcript_16194:23-268(-)